MLPGPPVVRSMLAGLASQTPLSWFQGVYLFWPKITLPGVYASLPSRLCDLQANSMPGRLEALRFEFS